MADHLTPQPEDQQQDSQPPLSPESPPDLSPDNSELHWVGQMGLYGLLFVVTIGLFVPALPRPRNDGATRSAQELRADRLQQIAEAQQLADESNAAR